MRWRSINSRVHSAPGVSSRISANNSCRPIARPSIARDDPLEEGFGEIGGIVESRAARDDRVLVLQQLLDDLDRPRRGGDHRLRTIAEAQAEQRLFESVGMAPGRQFVAPELHMLLAAQPVGLLGRKQ